MPVKKMKVTDRDHHQGSQWLSLTPPMKPGDTCTDIDLMPPISACAKHRSSRIEQSNAENAIQKVSPSDFPRDSPLRNGNDEQQMSRPVAPERRRRKCSESSQHSLVSSLCSSHHSGGPSLEYRTKGTNIYQRSNDVNPPERPPRRKDKSTFKLLWWCCICCRSSSLITWNF